MTSVAPVQPAALTAPEVAAGWLSFWRSLGGGVTIGADGSVNLWRWLYPGDQLNDLADRASDILGATPGLEPAVRACVEREIQGGGAA